MRKLVLYYSVEGDPDPDRLLMVVAADDVSDDDVVAMFDGQFANVKVEPADDVDYTPRLLVDDEGETFISDEAVMWVWSQYMRLEKQGLVTGTTIVPVYQKAQRTVKHHRRKLELCMHDWPQPDEKVIAAIIFCMGGKEAYQRRVLRMMLGDDE